MRDGTGVDPGEARVADGQILQAHVLDAAQVQGIVLLRQKGAPDAVGQLAFPSSSWRHEVQQPCLPVDVVLPLAVQLRQQIERVPSRTW